jgi:hypothetical protein
MEIEEITLYASDADLAEIQEKRITTEWMLPKNEAWEYGSYAMYCIDRCLKVLLKNYPFKGDINFILVSSAKPFQISKVGDNNFTIFVGQNIVYELQALCDTIEKIPPLSDFLKIESSPVDEIYRGLSAINIAGTMMGKAAGDFQKRSKLVFDAALLYILGHEFAHAAHGHLDFITSEHYKEFVSTPEDKIRTMRALEMDADSAATTYMIGCCEAGIENKKDILAKKEGLSDEEYITISRRRYVTGYLLMYLYSDLIAVNHRPKFHPISYARFITFEGVLNIVYDRLNLKDVSIAEETRAVLAETLIQLSGSINHLDHPLASNVMLNSPESDTPIRFYDPVITIQVYHAEIKPLFGRYSKMHPILNNYLRAGKLAPPDSAPN